jgi:hypothetical protein
MTNILRLPQKLEESERVLVSGAGGGFDVYAGIPIYERLRCLGKTVYLANLSFVSLASTDAKHLRFGLHEVIATSNGGQAYFPERTLARVLSDQASVVVYAFERLGLEQLRKAYDHLAQSLELDAIVLVDGGTDILLRGDEENLGTPCEDMTSLAAVAGLEVPTRIVACLGFGIDAYHGVSHANWLENVAALTAAGGFLGATALIERMPEVRRYMNAVSDADRATPQRPSIVNGSVVSAIEGHFGNYHRTMRTNNSELFINPLMSLLWFFDLKTVAKQNLYLDRLKGTKTMREVALAIQGFRETVRCRPRTSIPL